MQLETIRQSLLATGARDCHIDRVLRAWTQGKPLDAGPRSQPAEHYLPLALRNALAALDAQLSGLARMRSEHPGDDGSSRLLVDLADGQMAECVLLPREGVCVSTQIGCAVGCTFCMTGRDGLLRQVSSGEMVAQVVLARRLRTVRRVVFMGMGEPSHNIDNVLEAIDLLGTAGAIGHKNLVFSTVGDRRVFERLPQERVKPALAISLHTTRADLRAELLPKASRIDPAELIDLAEHYARTTGYPIQYQWTLLKGINDGQDELDELLRLFKGKYALLNVIPFNSLEGTGMDAGNGVSYERPDAERIREIVTYLHSRHVLTKVRNSAGQDVDAGCGQLRARAEGSAQRVNIRGLRDTRAGPGGSTQSSRAIPHESSSV
jgi:23S rRNA (adenine2503-C2)-methyltransferase